MSDQTENKELQILFPTAELTIAGEKIEVKEYTLKQQLQHNAKFVPFIASLRKTLGKSQDDFNLDELMECLSANYQHVVGLVALSIGKPAEFVENLNAREGEDLLMAWWCVNSDFFTRKAIAPIIEKMTKDNLQQVLAGAKS
ncbi:DUF6631 family protein [Aggregatibacter actinomycetemcomitans]|uniref:DUF6631 family protein n=1 Tax=Aggregatibacter actinomycetemcomitans TaxID=714 RepID=UPI00023FEBF8|nr:DUF6631 family protein [Aggregatibacter actinomycetemcomitans]EHK89816.1 hypothetical protein RHAA1_10781 [Aggregatibacter actinomycetemcomitans RhAA1]KNE76911.1 hypothetical protein RHAA2_11090 [Aggregatibacter actinomycetemcomitans RhAA1]